MSLSPSAAPQLPVLAVMHRQSEAAEVFQHNVCYPDTSKAITSIFRQEKNCAKGINAAVFLFRSL